MNISSKSNKKLYGKLEEIFQSCKQALTEHKFYMRIWYIARVISNWQNVLVSFSHSNKAVFIASIKVCACMRLIACLMSLRMRACIFMFVQAWFISNWWDFLEISPVMARTFYTSIFMHCLLACLLSCMRVFVCLKEPHESGNIFVCTFKRLPETLIIFTVT